MPEQKGLESGEVSLLMQTVRNDQRIKKLFEDGNIDDIVQALRYSQMLVGMRKANLPSKEETLTLLNFIATYYSGHTSKEIRLAFEMAVAGHFPGLDVRVYENFSVQYFASIMNAYRKWSAETYRQHMEFEQIKPPDRLTIELEYAQAIARDLKNKTKAPLIDAWIKCIK